MPVPLPHRMTNTMCSMPTGRGGRDPNAGSHALPAASPARALAAATAVSLCVGIVGVTFAVAGDAARPVLAPRQLVSHTDCQTAAQAAAKPDFLAKSAEFRDDVHISTRYCSATAHNQLSPSKAQIVVVGADPQGSRENKVFLKTIPANDAKKVHETCVRAGTAAPPYSQSAAPTAPGESATGGADVLTDSGKVDCEEFLRSTAADSPLVVLAPAALSGTAVSVHILNMIGHQRPAAEVQAEMDALGHQVATSAAMSPEERRKHPQIILPTAGPDLRPAAH